MTAKMLGVAWPAVKIQLCYLLNRCLKEAHFTHGWKTAKIIVIPKGRGKDPGDPKSYRPISLISSLSKILESLIINRLNAETGLDRGGQQHGFTQNRSTATAIKEMIEWTNTEKSKYVIGCFLDISKPKSQIMKGSTKPGYRVKFGSGEDNDTMTATKNVTYLGIIIDYERTYWDQVVHVAAKSVEFYGRIRQMSSANWGLGTLAAKIIYRSVFLPRCFYNVWAWEKGFKSKKAIERLGSAQRAPLLRICKAYRTISTDALQVVAGVPPLDLELYLLATRQKIKLGLAPNEELARAQDLVINVW